MKTNRTELLLKWTTRLLPFTVLAVLAIILLYFAKHDQAWEGGGDHFWHYFNARYAYKYPRFFLFHWGKPLFVLLCAPFAQSGLYGALVFNIVCGLLSAWIVYRFCKALNMNAPWLGIVITICSPIYFLLLQSAMTEPLFSLVFILSAYLLFIEKYIWGAVIASTILYTRSEGMFVVVIYFFYLLMMRQWKSIPFLGTAFLIYSTIGYFCGHNFFWYFTENPYGETSAYGHGTWGHFFKIYRTIWGLPGTIAFAAGFLLLIVSIFRNREYNLFKPLQKNMRVFVLVAIPVFAYSFFHIYAWAAGKYASAGLERVFACVIPGMAVICMYSISLLNSSRIHYGFRIALTLGALYFIVSETSHTYKYPLTPWGAFKAERDAAAWMIKSRKPGTVLYYAHPEIMLLCNYDPYDLTSNRECWMQPAECKFDPKEPSYILWDSVFSEGACGKVDYLKNCPNLRLLHVYEDMGFQLYVFEYAP